MIKICENKECSNEFKTTPSRAKRFCCKECYSTYSDENREPKYCLECGSLIEQRDAWSKYKKKFCNQSCAATYNNKDRILSNRICKNPQCGREFKPSSSNQKYCSWGCGIGKTPDYVVLELSVCENPLCHKEFRPDRAGRKYCSNECYLYVRGAKKIDKISKRTWLKMLRRAFPDWKCPFCEWTETFDVHHIVERGKGGTEDFYNLILVCPNHHSSIHRKKSLTEDQLRIHSLDKQITEEELLRLYYVGKNKVVNMCK